MNRIASLAAAAVVAVFGVGTVAEAAAVQPSGVWRNPKNSVHVKVQPCGTNVCGTVVWANARAKEKARKAGTPDLVGRQLFQDLRPAGGGSWNGRVFVPDMGRSFSGSLKPAGPNNMVAQGCLLGRYICKTQTWTRVG
ncbi:MAG TPA: DUF2147 domain-containing protein [Allosphingosinicella sp.]|jgi:uncharacterized protein (DUF2147 family)